MPFVQHKPTGGPYNTGLIDQSAWWDGSADYQSITFGAGNSARIGTINLWVQFTSFGSLVYLIDTGGGSNSRLAIRRTVSNQIEVLVGGTIVFETSTVLRDVRSYAIQFNWDTTQATASDRFTLLINGGEPAYDTDNRSSIAQNTDLEWGESGATGYLGRINSGASNFFQGYFAQALYTDGTEQGETVLGSFRSVQNGQEWTPISDASAVEWADAAGGNSFCLTSAIGDGTDASSNGNDFTPTSMSHAANGSDNTPSNQHAVINPIDPNVGTLSEGALTHSGSTSWAKSTLAIPVSAGGVWYLEGVITFVGGFAFGFQGSDDNADPGVGGSDVVAYRDGNRRNLDGSTASYGSGFSSGDRIGAELDLDNDEVRFYNDTGTSLGTISKTWTSPYVHFVVRTNTDTIALDVQVDAWVHTAPTGARAFNTANLPTGEVPSSPDTGSFTGNANADGPDIYLGYAPSDSDTLTINSNTVTWGTHALRLATGFKVISSSSSYNSTGTNNWSLVTTNARAGNGDAPPLLGQEN